MVVDVWLIAKRIYIGVETHLDMRCRCLITCVAIRVAIPPTHSSKQKDMMLTGREVVNPASIAQRLGDQGANIGRNSRTAMAATTAATYDNFATLLLLRCAI